MLLSEHQGIHDMYITTDFANPQDQDAMHVRTTEPCQECSCGRLDLSHRTRDALARALIRITLEDHSKYGLGPLFAADR